MAVGSTTASSVTSTSHTLTFPTSMVPVTPTLECTSFGSDATALSVSLQIGNRHRFLQPSASLPSMSLQVVKRTLDSFAPLVSDQQVQRLRALSAKRKRPRNDDGDRIEVLKFRRLLVDGFETCQVWQQAKRIIHGTLGFSQTLLRDLQRPTNGPAVAIALDFRDPSASQDWMQQLAPVANGLDHSERAVSESDAGQDDSPSLQSGSDVGDCDVHSDKGDSGNAEEEGESGSEVQSVSGSAVADEAVAQDSNGLNDRFFSLDEFNRHTLWLEEQDASGMPFTDPASDEDIDWAANPLQISTAMSGSRTKKTNKSIKSNLADEADSDVGSMTDDPSGLEDDEMFIEGEAGDEDEDEDEDEDDGPTFGNMALEAPKSDSEAEADHSDREDEQADEPEINANGIFYNHFFAPPTSKKAVGGRRSAKKSVRFDLALNDQDEAAVQRAMSDVKHDLFEDLSEGSDQDERLPNGAANADADRVKSRQSRHERRQSQLADQIRRLESELVAKRAWTLSGEAAAADRPVNSLLEEQLNFEHAGKPVPVITPDVCEAIEDLIKRRIIAREFDEVRRRRPDELPARRGLTTSAAALTLDDAKSSRGLAELYEEEHVRVENPDSYVNPTDERLQAEEREVERLWHELSGKLDALSSWHYRPRPPAPVVSVVADVAAVAMEDAQPTTALGVAAAAESVLAPQEIYRPGVALDGSGKPAVRSDEVVLRQSGAPVARAEMTREDRTRRRRRTKERIKKAGDTSALRPVGNGKAGASVSKPQGVVGKKRDTVAELRRGGVTVISRSGEIVDVDGNKARPQRQVTGSEYKL